MAVLGSIFLLVGCRYSALRIQCTSSGVRVVSLIEVTDCSFDTIHHARVDAQRRMRSSYSQEEAPFFTLSCMATSVGMWMDNSTGLVEHVIPHLEKNGVTIEAKTSYWAGNLSQGYGTLSQGSITNPSSSGTLKLYLLDKMATAAALRRAPPRSNKRVLQRLSRQNPTPAHSPPNEMPKIRGAKYTSALTLPLFSRYFSKASA